MLYFVLIGYIGLNTRYADLK